MDETYVRELFQVIQLEIIIIFHHIVHDSIIVRIHEMHVHIDVIHDIRIRDDTIHDDIGLEHTGMEDIEYQDIIQDSIMYHEHVYECVREVFQVIQSEIITIIHHIVHDSIIVRIHEIHVHIDVCHDMYIHDDTVNGLQIYHHVREIYHRMLIYYHEVISDLDDILQSDYSQDIMMRQIINVHIYVTLDMELNDIQIGQVSIHEET